jgi:4-amino-4-deoxy-L-arabinose transferase-like glycosyltransferase
LWIVLFWRLGYPSFWDPDEAHYAQTSREMLVDHNWFVPTYNGQPFFDKPVLFHWLQMVAFAALGTTELAARLVPALAAVGLVACTAWLGAQLFSVEVGQLSALLLLLLPATFALSAYAILDMLFTAFLFGGAALYTVAALRGRPRLQFPAYALVSLAVLTKGPVALALLGIAFGLSLIVAPAARQKLLSLHWQGGLIAVVASSVPWFLWMWHRFDGAFMEGYVLRENIWLFTRPLYAHQYSPFTYTRIFLVGLLPWTPILLGRIADAMGGRRLTTEERLLGAWGISIALFFMASSYRLDHYLYPAAPSLCVLAAAAWRGSNQGTARRHSGVWIGSLIAMATVGLAGLIFGIWFERVPVDLPPAARVAAVGLVAGSVVSLVQAFVQRPSLPRIPVPLVAGLVLFYGCMLLEGLPAFERAKPVRDLATWTARNATPTDRVASFRMARWSSSWRFYVNRPSPGLETTEQAREFFGAPGRGYCLMLEQDYAELRKQGLPLAVVYQREGLFTTTGRALRRAAGRRSGWRWFLVVTAADDLPPDSGR